MMKQAFFKVGQPIVLRQMSYGWIWQVHPSIVVCDTPEFRAFFKPPGAIWKDPIESISPAERAKKSWSFTDKEWGFGGILRLNVPGVAYSVLLLRNEDGTLFKYYINLEEPIYRTRFGFDYEDNILDIYIDADLSGWSWQDENELEEVVAAGLMTKERAAALYAEGEAAVALIQSGKSPFNDWEKWRPDPSWKTPVLPEGWDNI